MLGVPESEGHLLRLPLAHCQHPLWGEKRKCFSVKAETVCRFIIASQEEGKGFYLKALEETISISIFDHMVGVVLGVLHKLSN